MNTLIVMIGLPGSGKSTYGKRLKMTHPDWEYVSRDEIRYQFVTDQEHYFDHEYDVYKEFCNRIDMHLLNGKTVIADATHLNKKSRDKLLHNLSAKIDKKIALVMVTDFKTCMDRNRQREGITRVPDKTMHQMHHSFKVPDVRLEDFDQVLKVNGR